MSTGNDPCGIVRGPVQISFAKSVDPIFTQDITITRQARTNESDSATMGRKSIVPYGLYRADGYVSAMLAQKLPSFRKKTLNFCGMPLSICLNTTEVPQEVKCA